MAMYQIIMNGIDNAFKLLICGEVLPAERTAVKRNLMKDNARSLETLDICDRPRLVGVLHILKIAGYMYFAARFVVQKTDILLVEPFDKGYHAGNNKHPFHTIIPGS